MEKISPRSGRRRIGAALAAATVLVALAAGSAFAAVPAFGGAAPRGADVTPSYDFRDCPALPSGTDPARWRCEVLTAGGSLRMGSVTLPAVAPIVITHAEGPMPDGSAGQVWGGLRSGATRVPGGLVGDGGGLGAGIADRASVLGLALEPEYGGRSDFHAGGGGLAFTMRFRVKSPLLPRGCVIGGRDPVAFRLKLSGGSEAVSAGPPPVRFAATDDAFTVPAAEGCGPLGPLLDRRLGLPAAGGDLMSYAAYSTFKTYDQLLPK